MAAREDGLEDVTAAILELHAQNFAHARKKNVVPKFAIDTVGHYIRYANIKVFSSKIFPYMERIHTST